MSTKKKFVWLIGLTLVLIGVAGFWAVRFAQSQKPLAAVALGDGRILQVEAVTYGVDHHVGNERSDNLLWRFSAWLPFLHRLFPPRTAASMINGLDSPALVVWVNAVDAVTRTNVDCQRVRVELVSKRGERFEAATSSWFGGQTFWRQGHVFKVYPRDEDKLTFRVTTWKKNLTSEMEIPNPHVVHPEEWTGAELPQQHPAGNLNIILASMRLRTNNASPRYYETRMVYWEPVWELRRGTEKVEDWSEPEWLAEDSLGNRGQYLGTNQPVLRFSATFYPTTTNAAVAQLLATLPRSPVTNLQAVWWNQTARQGTNDILVLGLFPAGNRVFEDGHLLTNPPIPMGAVRGGAPSGWTGASKVVNPMKVVHYSGHYSITNSVIYVSAPDLPSPARLAMRLRDGQGRDWVAQPDGSANGIHPFLIQLPPDVIEITPELVLLPPATADFTVKIPKISNDAAPQ